MSRLWRWPLAAGAGRGCLMNAAARSGHSELAKDLSDVSPSDLAKYINLISNCATEMNLAGDKVVIEAAKSCEARLNKFVYHALLDAVRRVPEPEGRRGLHGRDEAGGHGRRRLLQHLIKAHLRLGRFAKARARASRK